MDDNAAGEVDRAPGGEPAAAPHPMRHRQIDHHQPDHRKQNDKAEPDALGKRADDQRRGDDRKGHLKQRDRALGKTVGLQPCPNPAQKGAVERADKRIARIEHQAVAERHPQQRYDAGDDKAVHQHRQQVPRANQPAIEQRQSRHGHEQDQGRGDDHPGGAAGVEHGRSGGEGRAGHQPQDARHRNKKARKPPRDAYNPGYHAISPLALPHMPKKAAFATHTVRAAAPVQPWRQSDRRMPVQGGEWCLSAWHFAATLAASAAEPL